MATTLLQKPSSKPDFTFRCQFLGAKEMEGTFSGAEVFRMEAIFIGALKELKAQARSFLSKYSLTHCKLCITKTAGVWIEQGEIEVGVHTNPKWKLLSIIQDPDDKTVFGYVCCPRKLKLYPYKLNAFKSEEAEVIIRILSKYAGAATNILTVAAGSLYGGNTIMSVENRYGFEVGSVVEVPMADGVPKYGVIRWMGNMPQVKGEPVAGLELEVKESACSDGTFNEERYFTCPAGRGFFVLLENCRPDSRFANSPTTDVSLNAEKDRRLMEENEPGGNVHRLVRELEEKVTHLQAELREKELRETSLHEKLKKKELLEETSRKQSAEIEQQLTNLRDVTQQMTIVQGQLQEKNEETANLKNQASALRQQLEEKDQEINELETTLSTAQDELREHQRQLRDVTQQITIVQGQLQEINEETANLQNQATALRQQLEEKDQEMNELETTLSTAQDELREYQRQQSPEWVISRDHIQLTGRFLGEGGWVRVVEGKYCGCSVAVKQMHKLILSPYNRNLFEREMDIASKCRHPCLLQFIGATNDEENPLFVTELMETSLRTLLEL